MPKSTYWNPLGRSRGLDSRYYPRRVYMPRMTREDLLARDLDACQASLEAMPGEGTCFARQQEPAALASQGPPKAGKGVSTCSRTRQGTSSSPMHRRL
jgi:hypothetical protein